MLCLFGAKWFGSACSIVGAIMIALTLGLLISGRATDDHPHVPSARPAS
jgi:hypothetical protein